MRTFLFPSYLFNNVRLRFSVGEYQIQGGILNDANGLVFTPWVTISDGPHAVEIEWTAGENNGLITLWLDGSQAATLTNVDSDTRRVDYATLGPVNIPGGTRGTLYLDAFESRRESLIGPDASALPPVAARQRWKSRTRCLPMALRAGVCQTGRSPSSMAAT